MEDCNCGLAANADVLALAAGSLSQVGARITKTTPTEGIALPLFFDRAKRSDARLGTFSEPSEGYRRQTVVHSGATMAGQGVHLVLQVGSTAILARLLAPRDFGLIAMVAAFVAFIGLFRDVGLTQAVTQKADLTHAQASNLFWINAAITLALSGLTILSSPLVVRFYSEPALGPITVVYALFLTMGGFGAMHQAVLVRGLQFKHVVYTEVAGQAIAIVIAVTLAYLGAGYWALVALPGARALAQTIGFWLVSPWAPGKPSRGAGISSLVIFGANVTGFNIVNFLARNLDNILIGWRWGAAALGVYAQAYVLVALPLGQINTPLSRVAVPMLARLQHEPDRYRQAYLRIVGVMCTLAVPIMATAIATADWIIVVVLGPGWGEAADILPWLALAGLFQPLTNTTGWLFMTQERTSEMFKLGIFSSGLAVLSFVIGLPYGALGVAISYALMDVFVRTPLAYHYVGRRGPVKSKEFARVMKVPLLLGGWAIGSAWGVRRLGAGLEPLWGLGIAVSVVSAGCGILVCCTPLGRNIRLELAALSRDFRRRGTGQ